MTRNNDSYRGKGRALFLAALMILSVVAVPFAFAGAGAAAVSNDAVDESHIEIQDGNTVYQGQEGAINVSDIDNQDNIELRTVDDDGNVGTLVARPSVENQGEDDAYVVVDTSERDTDRYTLTSNTSGTSVDDGNFQGITFEVVEMDLSAEFDDSEVTDTGADADTTFEIDSEIRNDYAVNVSAEDLTTEDLVDIFNVSNETDEHATAYEVARNNDQEEQGNYSILDEDEEVITLYNAEGEWDVDFQDITPDEYDFEVEVVDATASASDTINVSEAEGGSVNFAEAVDVNQGDIAEITLTADNTEEGTLVIGDADDLGYQANATVDFGDNDEVTVYFNTYAAGNGTYSGPNNGSLLWTDTDDASLSDVEQSDENLGGLLAAGYDYEMTAKAVSEDNDNYNDDEYDSAAEETLDAPDDVGSVFIAERSTDSVNLWTASENSVEDVTEEDIGDQPSAVADAIENSEVTETDSVAYNDHAIFQVQASGLAGLMANTTDNADDYSYNLSQLAAETNSEGDSRLKFDLTATASNPNADDTDIDVDPEDITLVHDKYGTSNEYFVIIETGDNLNELDEEDTNDLSLEFAVQDERLLGYDEDDDEDLEDVYQSIETEFDVVERTASLDVADSDLIEVEQGTDEITGTTNIAPGSEVTIQLRGTGDYRFAESQSEIVVNSDGTFAGEFDFSDREVDTTFEATLRSTGVPGDNPTEDGVVIAAADGEPDDGEEPPANDTDEGMDDGNVSDDGAADDGAADDGAADDGATDDGGSDDGGSSEETPGFGAIVALVAVLGAALLASRRQN